MNRLPNRLHCSSPTLNEGFFPILEKPQKMEEAEDTVGNEFLANLIASFYCKALIVMGVAIPITDAITLNRNIYFFRIFYIYLYSCSILFLCYVCLIQIKDKSVRSGLHQIKRFKTMAWENERFNQPVKYGSFYLRMGVTGFGMGSVIYAGFQFGQYFEYSSENYCAHFLKAIKPFLRIIFVLMQIFFILSTTNFVLVQKCKMTARFGLMHMIATNICEWFYVIVKGTQHDIYRSAAKFLSHNRTFGSNLSLLTETNRFYEEKEQCLETNIFGPLLYKTEPYLAPCCIEYSILCAVILGLIWKQNLTYKCKDSENCTPYETPVENRAFIFTGRKTRYSVDCSKAHKGLFSGILVLIVTLMSLILYGELEMHPQYRNAGFFLVSFWEFLLFSVGTVAAILCIVSLKDVGYYKKSRDLELEHLLLLLSQSGNFIYGLFQIMGAIHMTFREGLGSYKIMRILTSVLAVIQSCTQTTLVLVAWRRRCITKSHISKKPGKQLVTFLLIINFANWIICRFNHNKSTSHPVQMDFYGNLAWNIITHISMPLVLTYRFQSTVCFYEIWTHVYKTAEVQSSSKSFGSSG
ncbi:hypothetical protein WA026_009915 [Henosepilachna vigintioctopunctata]|uniref:Uncharacterized protein n=1 Tax=Henosepilachna vigintioctopunctata TaxID=420089 RepID=A0AAW1TLG9_9CUCU